MGAATRQRRLWGATIQDWAAFQATLALPLCEPAYDSS
jgi:hypothetical protein